MNSGWRAGSDFSFGRRTVDRKNSPGGGLVLGCTLGLSPWALVHRAELGTRWEQPGAERAMCVGHARSGGTLEVKGPLVQSSPSTLWRDVPCVQGTWKLTHSAESRYGAFFHYVSLLLSLITCEIVPCLYCLCCCDRPSFLLLPSNAP